MLPGLHHITAIAGDPQRNIDFYTQVLGLRLVKRTVNFDDPGSYHFYFGDREGAPGTLLTFFAWPTAPQGRPGSGQFTAVAFEIPRGSTGEWNRRLAAAGVECNHGDARFGDDVISFRDPEGLSLELIASGAGADVQIRRLHSATLLTAQPEKSASILTDLLRFARIDQQGTRVRYRCGDAFLDLLPSEPGHGKMGKGAVHHVAWCVADATQQLDLRERLKSSGARVSPVKNRVYFESIYFREPGGALIEIATEGPGFLVDEPAKSLGEKLCLPPWLEPIRESIERRLPPVHLNQIAWAHRGR
ncbi:MAG TPA: ring-cleaving dioxygenase [Bryobacteraceae bacterium]|jgi:glyoxalase family protein|nr:ring-cleaving dioxygenase [Bryobacteraceae bacterium]